MAQEELISPNKISEKLLLVLPSFPNLQNEFKNAEHSHPDLNEVFKSFMLQIFCQLEKYGEEAEKSDYYKWLKLSILNEHSDIRNFIREVETKRVQTAPVIEAIRQDVAQLVSKFVKTAQPIPLNEDHSIKSSDGAFSHDGFMYKNEKDVIQSKNLKSKFSCNACGSTETKPLELISHSASTESLIQLFTFRLPELESKKLLDIGSGLGSILYGAFYFSKASVITGIELNSGFCKVVEKIITKYRMQDRVVVVDGDLKNYASLLNVQDVVVFNNSFEFFMPELIQTELWQFIHENIKSGSFLVTNPNLITILTPLNLNYVNDGWVSEVPIQNIDCETLSGLDHTDEDFHVYIVN